MEIITILLTNVGSTLFKKYIYPRFGETGVHITVFAMSLIFSFIVYYKGTVPDVPTLLGTSGAVFASAVTLYEVILKKIGFFKGTK